MSEFRRTLSLGIVGTLILAGLMCTGYMNELLKAAISPLNRTVVLIGFIVGVGTISRYFLNQLIGKRHKR